MIKKLYKTFLIIIVIYLINKQIIITAQVKFPNDKIKDIEVIELEPIEFYTFTDYLKNDLEIQKKYSGVWTTLNQINLDKYAITSIASSNLVKQYLSSYLYDGKPETAWVEGVMGSGIDEWVKIKINANRGISEVTSTPFSIREVGIISGYAKSEKTWTENNRVKTLLFIVHSPSLSHPIKHEWTAFRLNLKDENKLQYFKLPEDLVESNDNPMTKTVWIKIEEVYKGTKYDDTCISELVLRGGCSN